MPDRRKKKPPSRRRRAGQVALGAAIGVVLLPLLLVPIYRTAPPVSALMVWTRLSGPIARQWVPLEAMAPSLVNAVLMSEDGRFCSHNGVDWEEIDKVIADDGERPRGASTIAMQTVKNLFLWRSRSYVRKGLEIPLALYADRVWGKRRTMEIYLNVAEWGPGVFGAEAAARRYFGRSASELAPGQSALLAATLPNPAARNPADPGPRLRALAARAAARGEAAGAYIDCLAP